jgi:hypothetical protein
MKTLGVFANYPLDIFKIVMCYLDPETLQQFFRAFTPSDCLVKIFSYHLKTYHRVIYHQCLGILIESIKSIEFDCVEQTLSLIQRRANDPSAVLTIFLNEKVCQRCHQKLSDYLCHSCQSIVDQTFINEEQLFDSLYADGWATVTFRVLKKRLDPYTYRCIKDATRNGLVPWVYGKQMLLRDFYAVLKKL